MTIVQLLATFNFISTQQETASLQIIRKAMYYKLKSISRRAIIASLALFGLFTIYGTDDTYGNVPMRNLEEKKVTRDEECHGWCIPHPDPWDMKCTYKHCKGCSECTDQESQDEQTKDEQPPPLGECNGWCIPHPDPWDMKCTFKHCNGCSQCLELLDAETFLHETIKPANVSHVDRIYYINMDHRTDKRDWMESWLEPFSKTYSIPYQRISGKRGDEIGDCNKNVREEACNGLTGLIYSNFDIMDNHNTTGITIVLEDDYMITQYSKLVKSLSMAPDDWDVIRFDSWGKVPGYFPRIDMGDLGWGFRTIKIANGRYFCGGTHITVWRGDKVSKLRKHWDASPRWPIDCRLAADNITAYSLSTNVGRRDLSRGSDVPKRILESEDLER